MSSNVAVVVVVVAAIAAIKLPPIGAAAAPAARRRTCRSARAFAGPGLGSTDTDRPRREHRVGRIRSHCTAGLTCRTSNPNRTNIDYSAPFGP